MSIGIVVATTTDVLMVADGRRSVGSSVLEDAVEKIVAINDLFFVIEFGVVIGSNDAVQELKSSLELPVTGEKIVALVGEKVHCAAVSFLKRDIPSSYDMERMKVGLLVGGIDVEGPFIGGALFGYGMQAPSIEFARPTVGSPQFICLGGENYGSATYFLDKLQRALRVAGDDSDSLLGMFKRAAGKTVKHIATLDSTVGGQVRYQILSMRFPRRSGLL